MKKVFSLMMAALLVLGSVLMFGACAETKPTITIIQFGSHGSLNNCYDGVIAGLEEGGITLSDYNVVHVDSNFDPTTAQSQAQTAVNSGSRVIIAIATPTAVAAASAADGDIPVVFCAITDQSVMENYENVTGSSDIPNFAKQLEVVTGFMGRSDLKIGVLYSSEESSSPIQVTRLKEAASAYTGMEIRDSVVTDINTIDTKVNALISEGVDCFINMLDNTVVGKLQSNILPLTDEAGIPVFGSEIEQVKVGCAASASIEYVNVGKQAGLAAAQLLLGQKANASDIPVAVITDPNNYYNSEVCARLGLTVPSDLEATDVAGEE